MSQWYYTRNGERQGPVERSTLSMLAQSDEVKPEDLVWTEGMADWKPASTVEGLFAPPPSDPANPYASPASMISPAAVPGPGTPVADGEALEILDPPAPLTVGGPLDLAMNILKKHFGMILAAGVVYIAVIYGVSTVLALIGMIFGAAGSGGISFSDPKSMEEFINAQNQFGVWDVISNIIQQFVGIFMALGLARVGLDVIEGKPVQIGLLFSQGSKVLGAFGGTILLSLAIGLPVAILVVPIVLLSMQGGEPTPAGLVIGIGIGTILILVWSAYLGARFGFFKTIMVDRGMGVMDAFRESSRLTNGNKWAVIGLYLVMMLINLAGMLMLCVGLIFTMPLTILAWYVAYKWMLHGPEALNRIPNR